MSAQPIWITPPGPLQGPIAEGTYFQVPLQVSDTATLDITGISKISSSVTVTFAPQYTKPFQIGDSVILSNVTPTSYNGTYTVTSSTNSQVTFISSNADQWMGTGTVSSVPSTVYFEVVAGSLPAGVECTSNGVVQGVPTIVTPDGRAPIDIIGAFGNGTTVTLRFAEQPTPPYPLGYAISVSDINPQSYNGPYFVVIACSTTSVSYVSSATGNYSGGGQVAGGYEVDTTSKFAIRAYTKTNLGTVNRFADNTFTLTVEGQNLPQWITPAGEIGQYWDGELLSPGIQLLYTNDNLTGIPPAITLIRGTLPPGITITDTGLISGFIGLDPSITAIPGFSRTGQGFDEYPFDFSTQGVTANYEFTLKLTDGRTSSQRTFSMFVYATSVFNASTTLITVDDTYLIASISTVSIPVINNPQGSIGIAQSDTFFAYQFTGRDLDNNQIAFLGTFLPPGLTLNPITGWLYGYLPQIGLTENIYNFIVQAYVYNQSLIVSDPYQYSLTVTGPISSSVTWITPSNLGSIVNGSTSILYVRATTTASLNLQYRLASGSNSKLPQGLTLEPSGDIVGRVSFNTFALDGGNTTFDRDTTTFDLTFTFVVNAYTRNGYISVNQTFTLNLIRLYDKPYYNLYIQCMPPYANRDLINNLLQNTMIFPPALLYRTDDYNFGVSTNVIYRHAYGLDAVSLDTYVEALQLNHYWKNLTLGQIKTAQAVDPLTGNVIYEVVYSEIIDNMVNNDDVPADKEVVLAYPLDPGTPDEIDVVYPNPLEQMRNQVIDVVGQESKILPLWMQSVQADGSVLGFTRAWVIAYTNPGESGQIAYNIATQFTGDLNTIDFEADRYELDNALTVNWDPDTQEWIPHPPLSTTFDINYHYTVYINDGGLGYTAGDIITILGSEFGGVDGINDCTMKVDTVSVTGEIINAFFVGTATILMAGNTYNGLSGTGGIGSGALWDIQVVPGLGAEDVTKTSWINDSRELVLWTNDIDATTTWTNGTLTVFDTLFDGGSLTFNDPADMNTNTDAYNKYLLYPKQNILG
jgi:hypothetical protein